MSRTSTGKGENVPGCIKHNFCHFLVKKKERALERENENESVNMSLREKERGSE